MREFVVEVPALIRVTVDAVDAGAASRVAGKIVDSLEFGESLERVGGVWQLVQPEIVPLDADLAQPDVYICEGGMLSYVNDNDTTELTDLPCVA